MRFMVTYYTGEEYKIADVHLDELDSKPIQRSQIADDCEDIISMVEVLSGVDYDKANLGRTLVDQSGNEFTAIILK